MARRKINLYNSAKPKALYKSLRVICQGLFVVFFILCVLAYHVGLVVEWLVMLPFRILRYIWRFEWGRFWIISIAILLAAVLVGMLLRAYYNERAARIQAQTHATGLVVLLDNEHQRTQLILAKMEATQSGVGRHVSPAGKDYVVKLIDQVFGPEAEKAKKVFNCESGYNPFNYHINKDGSLDGGVAQVNNRWHKERFEKMFGVPFEIGVYVPELNVQYAKYLWDHSGPNPWVCSKILGV